MLALLISLIGAGCSFSFESLGLKPGSALPENPSVAIQLSPPAEILPDLHNSLDDARGLQLAGEITIDIEASPTPFLPFDASASPTLTSTPTSTFTPSPSPTVTWTVTITLTMPPATQPNTATHTATRTNTPAPWFTPTHTASPTKTELVSTVPPPPTATDTPAPTAPAPCDPDGDGSFESALIGLINQERQARGLDQLSSQSQIATAARNHSADMACNGFFSHTGSDGTLPWDRASALGYNYSAIAENIFAGSSNAQTAYNAWMNSPGHRDNMLNPTYSEIGIGYRYLAGSPYGAYTTAVFARPR